MKNKIHHYRWKEHLKYSKKWKALCQEMLQNAKNIAMRNLPTHFYNVWKFAPHSHLKRCNSPLVIQKHTKLTDFAWLHFLHFATFRDKTFHFLLYLRCSLYSCSDGFCFSYLDENLAKHWNCLLVEAKSTIALHDTVSKWSEVLIHPSMAVAWQPKARITINTILFMTLINIIYACLLVQVT